MSSNSDPCSRFHRGNTESVAAFNSIKSSELSRLRKLIYDSIVLSSGATCDELESTLGLSHQSCSARITELKQAGIIYSFGKRKTRSGRDAAVLYPIAQ